MGHARIIAHKDEDFVKILDFVNCSGTFYSN